MATATSAIFRTLRRASGAHPLPWRNRLHPGERVLHLISDSPRSRAGRVKGALVPRYSIVTWDVVMGCRNKYAPTFRASQNVNVGAKVGRFIPQEDIKDFNLCDQVVSLGVSLYQVEPIE
jgi:hypothetical protein